jgi:hypothetical protein
VASWIIGSLAGYLTTSRILQSPLEKLNLVTPVFVLDRSTVIKSLPPDASRETIDRAMAALREKADRLAGSGYLVIDAGLVVAAPEDIYVRDVH